MDVCIGGINTAVQRGLYRGISGLVESALLTDGKLTMKMKKNTGSDVGDGDKSGRVRN